MNKYIIKAQTKRIAEVFAHFQKIDAEKSDNTFVDILLQACEHRIDLTAHIAEHNELMVNPN